MRIPKLQKRYKVVWEFYYEATRKTTKTYENVTREIGLAWVRELLKLSITSNVRITDYEGHWSAFEPNRTETCWHDRETIFEAYRAVYGDRWSKELRQLGDSKLENAPLFVKANVDFIVAKKQLIKAIDCITAGEKTNPSLYIVEGLQVHRVITRYAALKRGDYHSTQPLPALSEVQKRLVKSVGMWHEYLDKDVPQMQLTDLVSTDKEESS